MPWCYTTDPEDSWDYCDVPFCELHCENPDEELAFIMGLLDVCHNNPVSTSGKYAGLQVIMGIIMGRAERVRIHDTHDIISVT